jgi:hypothetical protein
MRTFLSIITLLTWSLWFGGMIALFLFVMRLFGTSRELGSGAAPVLFSAFASYQLIVGMIACACGTLVTLMIRRKAHAIATLLMLGALAGGLVIRSWTNEMRRLDRSLAPDVARFQTLHHSTTRLYTSMAAALMISGIIWVVAPVPVGTARRTEKETAVA